MEGFPAMQQESQTITVEEAARLLGINRNTAYAAVHAGELPVIRIRKRFLVPKVALQRMLEAAGQKPQDGKAA
jgi:excisionase family DNA binding protein